MKIAAKNSEVSSNIIMTEENHSKFSIQISEKAFDVLSSTIYKNPIQAVIREIISNALDANKESGSKEKIIIQTPDALFPNFTVRDYGKGMSKNEILNLYSTYFYSTKSNTNNLVGGFGVGSKSPFAISDMFSVVSYQNGIEMHFTMYKDSRGIPSVTFVCEKATNEPNGVLVTVPVKQDLQKKFCDELAYFKRCLSYILPEYAETPIEGFSYSESVQLAKINSSIAYRSCVDSFFVISGYTLIAVDTTHFPKVNEILKNNSIYIPYMQYAVVRTEVGELDIPVSREEIQKTESNDLVLAKYLENFFNKLNKDVKAFCKTIDSNNPYILMWNIAKATYNKTLPEPFNTHNQTRNFINHITKNKFVTITNVDKFIRFWVNHDIPGYPMDDVSSLYYKICEFYSATKNSKIKVVLNDMPEIAYDRHAKFVKHKFSGGSFKILNIRTMKGFPKSELKSITDFLSYAKLSLDSQFSKENFILSEKQTTIDLGISVTCTYLATGDTIRNRRVSSDIKNKGVIITAPHIMTYFHDTIFNKNVVLMHINDEVFNDRRSLHKSLKENNIDFLDFRDTLKNVSVPNDVEKIEKIVDIISDISWHRLSMWNSHSNFVSATNKLKSVKNTNKVVKHIYDEISKLKLQLKEFLTDDKKVIDDCFEKAFYKIISSGTKIETDYISNSDVKKYETFKEFWKDDFANVEYIINKFSEKDNENAK